MNTDTVDSVVCSEATRWIAIVRIFRARSSPSSRARCSISRTVAIARRLASSTTSAIRASLASWAVIPAIRSSCRRWFSAAFSSSSRTRRSFWSRSSSSLARRSTSESFRSRVSSRWARRSSFRLSSSRRARMSASASRRIAAISSFTSRSDCRTTPSASRSASRRSFWARASALWTRVVAIICLIR